MLKRTLLAHTALVGALSLIAPAIGLAADVSVASGASSGTVALTSGQGLNVAAGGTVTSTSSTAAVSQSSTATGATATITNAGTISNTNASGRAIDLNDNTNRRSLTVTNSGTIGAGDDAIRVNKALVAGSVLTITNSGTITSTSGQALDLKSMTNTGVTTTITNTATGVISAADADVIRPGVGAGIVNAGVICAGSYAAGACTSSTSTGDGIDTQSNTGVTVTNQTGGLVSGAKHGITGDYGPTVVNQAGATIEGRNGSGVNIDNATINATTGTFTALTDAAVVTNYGTITGTGTDGDGVDVDGQVTVNNYGTIHAQSATGTNTAEAIAAGGGTINNYAGATLVGAHNGILIDNGSTGASFAAALPTTVTNAGTIEGQSGYAIKLVGSTGYNSVSLDDSITNSGTIKSTGGATVIDMGGGNDTLINSGTISGIGSTTAIQMGAGDDTVVINGGGVSGGAIAGGDGTDTLYFFRDATGTFSFDGAITGFETIRAQAGTVTLRGAVDTTTALTVDQGATLRVNTAFTTGALTVNGTLAAAENSATRTTTVTGDYAQGAAGVLEVRVASASDYDKVQVAGTATLANGATIRPLTGATTYIANNTTLNVLTATGLTVDASALVIDYSSPLVSWLASTNGTTLMLTANRTSYGRASGDVASGAGGVLESVGATATGDMATVINTLEGQGSVAAVGQAVRQLAPIPSGGALNASRAVGNGTVNTVQNRLAALRQGSMIAGSAATGASLAEAASPALATAALAATAAQDVADPAGPVLGVGASTGPARTGVWAQGFGANADQQARDDVEGYRSHTAGLAFGGDTPIDDDTVLGFAGSFARTFVSGRGSQDSDRTTVDSYQLTAYGSRAYGNAFVEGVVTGGRNSYTGRRVISFLGRTADADYQGWQGLAKVTAGHAFPLDGLTLTPTASLQYAHTHLDSYTETGAGAASLSLDGQDYDTLTPGIGFRLAPDAWSLGGGALTATMTGTVSYDVVADRQSVNAAFTGGGGTFVTDGADPARAAITGGLGLSYRIDDVEIGAGYQVELREDYVGQAAMIRLRHDL